MAERPSEVRTMLPCPRCDRALFPTPVESGVIFHCKNGHELALGELLTAQSAILRGGLEALLADWIRLQEALTTTAEDARKNGCLNVAKIFNRHAKSVGTRIGKVRDAFSQSDSSRLIKLPEVLRPAQPAC